MNNLPTLKEYQDAVELAENHKICDGCKHLFHSRDIQQTIYWGIKKFWCTPCYAKVKDDD